MANKSITRESTNKVIPFLSMMEILEVDLWELHDALLINNISSFYGEGQLTPRYSPNDLGILEKHFGIR